MLKVLHAGVNVPIVRCDHFTILFGLERRVNRQLRGILFIQFNGRSRVAGLLGLIQLVRVLVLYYQALIWSQCTPWQVHQFVFSARRTEWSDQSNEELFAPHNHN